MMMCFSIASWLKHFNQLTFWLEWKKSCILYLEVVMHTMPGDYTYMFTTFQKGTWPSVSNIFHKNLLKLGLWHFQQTWRTHHPIIWQTLMSAQNNWQLHLILRFEALLAKMHQVSIHFVVWLRKFCSYVIGMVMS